jgi:hypothetical protein
MPTRSFAAAPRSTLISVPPGRYRKTAPACITAGGVVAKGSLTTMLPFGSVSTWKPNATLPAGPLTTNLGRLRGPSGQHPYSGRQQHVLLHSIARTTTIGDTSGNATAGGYWGRPGFVPG